MSNKSRTSANELNLQYAIPVGEYIKDEMNFRGLNQTEMALLLGVELPKLNKILNGSQRLTADVALKIEGIWGIPAHIYMDLQSQYEIDVEKISERNNFYKLNFSYDDKGVYAPQSVYAEVDNAFNGSDNFYKQAA